MYINTEGMTREQLQELLDNIENEIMAATHKLAQCRDQVANELQKHILRDYMEKKEHGKEN